MALTDNLEAFWEFDDLTDAHSTDDLTGTNTPTFAADAMRSN